MEEDAGNPKTNRLGAGFQEKDLHDAIRKSGYPLQHRVVQLLQSEFRIIEDRVTGEPRALDVLAQRAILEGPERQVQLGVTLLLECKKSELPFVFFDSTTKRMPPNFPRVFGYKKYGFTLQAKTESREGISPAEVLCLGDLPFVSSGPPVCRTYARPERKGEALDLSGSFLHKDVVMPLVSAVDHRSHMYVAKGGGPPYNLQLTLLLGVLEAPMVLASGPEDSVRLSMAPWVRLVRHEASQHDFGVSASYYVVDFVHVDFLTRFVSGQLFPFLEDVVRRIEEGKSLILRGNGDVPSLEGWTWHDLIKTGKEPTDQA